MASFKSNKVDQFDLVYVNSKSNLLFSLSIEITRAFLYIRYAKSIKQEMNS